MHCLHFAWFGFLLLLLCQCERIALVNPADPIKGGAKAPKSENYLGERCSHSIASELSDKIQSGCSFEHCCPVLSKLPPRELSLSEDMAMSKTH